MDKDRWDKEQWDREFRDDFHGSLHDDIHRSIHDNIRDDAERVRERVRERWRGRHGHGGGGNSVVVGAIVVLVGIVFLLDNIGLLRIHDIWRFWPLILVAVGVGRILECRRPAALVWGAMLCLIGGVFLLDNLHIVSLSFNLIWPLLIICFGISMLMKSADRVRFAADPGDGSSATLSLWAVFGGGRRRITTADFRGGEVFAIFGGFHIDLRGAQIPSGRAVVDVNAIFGGVDMTVPENWRVTVRGTGVFGAFEDKTLPPRPDVGVMLPELVITGSAVFGGTTVRN